MEYPTCLLLAGYPASQKPDHQEVSITYHVSLIVNMNEFINNNTRKYNLLKIYYNNIN